MNQRDGANFFERVKKGLEDSLAYSRGELTLRTTKLPAPPPPASARQIVALRSKLKMSQSVFAALLNVSPRLVQSWEQDLRKPSRGELRLIQILMQEPGLVTRFLIGGNSHRGAA